MEKTVYLPDVVGSGYRAFWTCRKRYRVVKGGKASKKSSTAALWFIYHMMRLPGSNLLVVRQVYRTHTDSTFAQLKWAIRRLCVEHLWESRTSPLELRYRPTGQKILFRGLDSVDKLASAMVEKGTLCWVWIEEAFEIAREADFNTLDLSVPRGRVEPPLFKQTTLTFNPWNEAHWLKRRFFDTPRKDTLALTTNYLCNEFLDETDRALYEEMRQFHPRRYAVAGLGEWGMTEGLVFENWRVEAFDPAALPENCRRVFGLDYGYVQDPTAFIAAAVQPGERRLFIFDEFYGRRMLNGDIAQAIRSHGYAKERIRADSAEPKSNEDLRRLGIARILPAPKGPDSVRNGIARLQEYEILVHPACRHTAEELAAYVWETAEGGGLGRFRNQPVDRDNHLMDALRYAMTDVPEGARGTRVRPGIAGALRPDELRSGWNE